MERKEDELSEVIAKLEPQRDDAQQAVQSSEKQAALVQKEIRSLQSNRKSNVSAG